MKARENIFLGCCCILACLFLLVGISTSAAIVVFNNDSVLVASKLTEKNDGIIVTLPEGEVTFARDQVTWYSKDDNLVSLWEAAQLAEKEGRPEIGVRLAKEVLVKESLHGSEARAMIFQLEQKKLEKVQATSSRMAANPAVSSSESGFVPLNPTSTPAAGGFKGVSSGKVGAVETGKQIEAAPESVSDWPVEELVMSAEDLRVNFIIAGIFGLIILFSVWKITVSD